MNSAGGPLGHQPRKRFGQHFLRDASIIDAIVANANPQADDIFVEIGPGLGALTVPLLKRLDHLHVVELDRDIVPRLAKLPGAAGKLTVHQADALKFDFASIDDRRQIRIIGNLPYNISTPLLFHLLGFRGRIRDMHFMLQREVVQRLAAKPNCREYGRLSLIAQYHYRIDPLLDVPPSAFYPPPKVESAVVVMTRKATPGHADTAVELARAGFGQRRKMLRRSLAGVVADPETLLRQVGIDPKARAETLSPEDYLSLGEAMS